MNLCINPFRRAPTSNYKPRINQDVQNPKEDPFLGQKMNTPPQGVQKRTYLFYGGITSRMKKKKGARGEVAESPAPRHSAVAQTRLWNAAPCFPQPAGSYTDGQSAFPCAQDKTSPVTPILFGLLGRTEGLSWREQVWQRKENTL